MQSIKVNLWERAGWRTVENKFGGKKWKYLAHSQLHPLISHSVHFQVYIAIVIRVKMLKFIVFHNTTKTEHCLGKRENMIFKSKQEYLGLKSILCLPLLFTLSLGMSSQLTVLIKVQKKKNQISFLKSVGTPAKEKNKNKKLQIILDSSLPLTSNPAKTWWLNLWIYILHIFFSEINHCPCNPNYHYCSNNLLNEKKKKRLKRILTFQLFCKLLFCWIFLTAITITHNHTVHCLPPIVCLPHKGASSISVKSWPFCILQNLG